MRNPERRGGEPQKETKKMLEGEALQTYLEDIAYQYGGHSDYWDAELAAEIIPELRKEEEGLTGPALRDLLMRRFLDATYPGGPIQVSNLYKTYNVAPLKIHPPMNDLETGFALVSLGEDFRNREKQIIAKELFLYGDDIIGNVKPGEFFKFSPEKVRALGSAGFDACSSLLGKNEKGELCLSHIPGPSVPNTRRVLGDLLDLYGKGSYHLISPQMHLRDNARTFLKTAREEQNHGFQELADEYNIPLLRYAEGGLGEASTVPAGTKHIIILNEAGFQVRQARQFHEPPTNPNKAYELRDEIIHDIEF